VAAESVLDRSFAKPEGEPSCCLYEAAEALKASPSRTFWTVTIPARYGLISAVFVVFPLVITVSACPK
jgi:ABC-type Fe3+ transport system permease subunit